MTKFEISPTKYRELLDSIDLRLANLTRALGTIATDSLRVSVVDHFLPDADALRDLGSSTRRWRQGFFGGTVGIGTSTPHTSAILDLTSTTQGMLLPRMTTAQRDAITTPSDGLCWWGYKE